MHKIKLVPCVALMYLLTFTGASSRIVFTCDEDSYVQHLGCDKGVISVKSALYGRADEKICPSSGPVTLLVGTECSKDKTLKLVKSWCDGKKKVELSMVEVRRSIPCVGTNKYLKIDYSCTSAVHLIICEGSTSQIKCGRGHKISVIGADYGRHDDTTCSKGRPESQLKDHTCSKPATKIVADKCNGKNSCSVTASNAEFTDPCFKTYKYLEVSYVCLHTK